MAVQLSNEVHKKFDQMEQLEHIGRDCFGAVAGSSEGHTEVTWAVRPA